MENGINFVTDGLAKRFGLTPAQFAENLRDNYQRHEIDQEGVEPLELAKEYCGKQFTAAEDVLRAAKFMVAHQVNLKLNLPFDLKLW